MYILYIVIIYIYIYVYIYIYLVDLESAGSVLFNVVSHTRVELRLRKENVDEHVKQTLLPKMRLRYKNVYGTV